MKMKAFRLLVLMAIMAVGTFYGCSDDDDSTGPEVVVTDDQLEAALAELMQQSMEMMEDSSGIGDIEPTDYDFRPVHAVFVGYLQAHPGHARASFGAAFSSVMILTTDSTLNSIFDSFQSDSAEGSRLAAPMLLRDTRKAVLLPRDLRDVVVTDDDIARSYFTALNAAAVIPVHFSEIQQAIRDQVMPALDNGLHYVNNIVADTSFVFWITPELMDDVEFDSTEVDHTDILALAAGVRGLMGVLHMLVAYDADLSDFDTIGIAEILDREGDWLSLYPTGAADMSSAKSDFVTAIGLARQTVVAAYEEPNSDPYQDDDVLVADWDSASQAAYLGELDNAADAFVNQQWIHMNEFEEDGEEGELPDSVLVDLGQVFDNPIEVPASYLPAFTYTLTPIWDTSYDGLDIVEIDSNYVIEYTWEADSVAGLDFPDPTFNGILPGMTTDSAFIDLIGTDDSIWSKTEVDTIPMAYDEAIGWAIGFVSNMML